MSADLRGYLLLELNVNYSNYTQYQKMKDERDEIHNPSNIDEKESIIISIDCIICQSHGSKT
jgi:hypothetical protein